MIKRGITKKRSIVRGADLIALYTDGNTIKDIAKMFNVGYDVAYKELRIQREKKKYGSNWEELELHPIAKEVSLEILSKSLGAWMNSKERQTLNKQI